MNKLTRIAFNLFKISSLGLIICYLIAIVTVGAAGHSSGDPLSFTIISLYSIALFFSVYQFQKSYLKGKSVSGVPKFLLIVLIIPIMVLVSIGLIGLLTSPMRSYTGSLFMISIFFIFAGSGLIIIKFIVFNKEGKAQDEKTIN